MPLENNKKETKKSFGAWNLTKEEKKEIWNDITSRSGRKWEKRKLIDLLEKPLSGGKKDVDAIKACKSTWKMERKND